MEQSTDFIYRSRPDGHWEAICTRCLRTLKADPTASSVEGLDRKIAVHPCDAMVNSIVRDRQSAE